VGRVESGRVHAASRPRVRAAAMSSGRAALPMRRRPAGARKRAAGRAEGDLGDGRRPDPAEAAVLDETAVTRGLAASGGGPPFRELLPGWRAAAACRDRGRQKPRHEPGSRPRRPRPGAPSGGAVDRGSTRTARCPLDASSGHVPGHAPARSMTEAEAGGSPSSDAPPEGWPEVQGPKAGRRTQRKRPREGSRPRSHEGSPAREAPRGRSRRGDPARETHQGGEARSGIEWSVLGARGRKSVAEVGETHLSPCSHGDSLKRPTGL